MEGKRKPWARKAFGVRTENVVGATSAAAKTGLSERGLEETGRAGRALNLLASLEKELSQALTDRSLKNR